MREPQIAKLHSRIRDKVRNEEFVGVINVISEALNQKLNEIAFLSLFFGFLGEL